MRDILKYIDHLDLLKREEDPNVTPFFLADAHGSRFSLEFLKYIHEEEHRWRGFIGLPNGTAWWQVHDSEENNGCFQREMVLAKKDFLMEKRNRGAGIGLKVQIEKF